MLSWSAISRLGLVQASPGSIGALTTATLSRVMAVGLALPECFVALHHGVQVGRPSSSLVSDAGGRWGVEDTRLSALGAFCVVGAVLVFPLSFALGVLVLVLAYGRIGLGVGAAPEPHSSARLRAVMAGATLAAAYLRVRRIERRRGPAAPQSRSAPFWKSLRKVWSEPQACARQQLRLALDDRLLPAGTDPRSLCRPRLGPDAQPDDLAFQRPAGRRLLRHPHRRDRGARPRVATRRGEHRLLSVGAADLVARE